MSSADGLALRDGALTLAGALDRASVPALAARLRRLAPRQVRTIDLGAVTRVDSAAFVADLRMRFAGATVVGAGAEVAATLAALTPELGPRVEERREPALARLGGRIHAGLVEVREVAQLAADAFAAAAAALVDRSGHRRGAVVEQGVLIGLDAVGVVGLLSFIIGLILSLQAAAQLRLVGANIFVADLVAVSMVREMGPMMTAVLIAGRSGSAMAAEIATMKVSEEIDALRTMAIDPVRYVVVPKLLAITLVSPLLVTLSTLIGIFGGLLVAVGYLRIPVIAYVNESIKVLRAQDILSGLAKSVVFAWLIAVISSHCGLHAAGGAEGVGRETTRSVVASIFAVIVADVIFSLVYLP
jgi:phospholipid/cholesterol/gamma-HCH transport system permease protein